MRVRELGGGRCSRDGDTTANNEHDTTNVEQRWKESEVKQVIEERNIYVDNSASTLALLDYYGSKCPK